MRKVIVQHELCYSSKPNFFLLFLLTAIFFPLSYVNFVYIKTISQLTRIHSKSLSGRKLLTKYQKIVKVLFLEFPNWHFSRDQAHKQVRETQRFQLPITGFVKGAVRWKVHYLLPPTCFIILTRLLPLVYKQ